MADNWQAISGYASNNYTDTMVFEVDGGTKQLQKISGQTLIAGEKNSQYIRFIMPRYWDGIDVSDKTISIVHGLAGKYYGETGAVSAERTDDKLRFGWIVPASACCIAGSLLFVLVIKDDDYVLKTQITETPVLKSIDLDSVVPEPTKEAWYREFQARVEQALSSAEDAVAAASEVATRAQAYVGAPLVASTYSDMTDSTRIYVYTGSETGYSTGHWYYWTGSAWEDGGVYNAVAVDTDTTLSIPGKAADAKKTGDEISSLKEDLNAVGAKLDWYDTNVKEYRNVTPQLPVTRGYWTIVENVATITAVSGGYFYAAPSIPVSEGERYRVQIYARKERPPIIFANYTNEEYQVVDKYEVSANGIVVYDIVIPYGVTHLLLTKYGTNAANYILYEPVVKTDKTLTESDIPADSAAVGAEFGAVRTDVSNLGNTFDWAERILFVPSAVDIGPTLGRSYWGIADGVASLIEDPEHLTYAYAPVHIDAGERYLIHIYEPTARPSVILAAESEGTYNVVQSYNTTSGTDYADYDFIMPQDVTHLLLTQYGPNSQNTSVHKLEPVSAEEAEDLTEKYFHPAVNNLYDLAKARSGASIKNTDGTITTNASVSTFYASDYIPVEEGHTYTWSRRSSSAWYDEDKTFISGNPSDDGLTLVAPEGAAYCRFGFNGVTNPWAMMNEGDKLLPFDYNAERLDPIYFKDYVGYRLELVTRGMQAPFGAVTPLILLAVQTIYTTDGVAPQDRGYLFANNASGTWKLYWSNHRLEELTYLCDWNNTVSGGASLNLYQFTITADGDIICVKKRERANPIVYPHADYTNPYSVNFGDTLKPASALMSPMAVAFADGSVIWGDYKSHSSEDETNHDPRCIWKLTKPYNDVASWSVKHRFNHIKTEGHYSDDPDNDIGHVHTIAYDWYANEVYCTTGDHDAHCRIWKSGDGGETWAECVSNGQDWRTVGLIFTEDACYYATDSINWNHYLYKLSRDPITGSIDWASRETVVFLEPGGRTGGQATYCNILMRDPSGLLIIDQPQSRDDGKVDMLFYSFADKQLSVVHTFKLWDTGANRGLVDYAFNIYQSPYLDGVVIGGAHDSWHPNNTKDLGNRDGNRLGFYYLKIVPRVKTQP